MVQHFFSFLFAPSSEFKDENPFGQNEMTHCRRPTDLYFEIQPILAKRRSDYLETRITQNESPNCGRQIRASLLDTEGSGQNLVGEGGDHPRENFGFRNSNDPVLFGFPPSAGLFTKDPLLSLRSHQESQQSAYISIVNAFRGSVHT